MAPKNPTIPDRCKCCGWNRQSFIPQEDGISYMCPHCKTIYTQTIFPDECVFCHADRYHLRQVYIGNEKDINHFSCINCGGDFYSTFETTIWEVEGEEGECPFCGNKKVHQLRNCKVWKCDECDDYWTYFIPSPATVCPVCSSRNITLYNALKMTYHCQDCNNYWDRFGRVIYPTIYVTRKGRGWNGFTDPDDFPTDGFGDSEW